jgi:hypothetical protein
MTEFLKGKYPLADKRIILNNIKISKFLINKGQKQEAQELQKTIKWQMKKYNELYRTGEFKL